MRTLLFAAIVTVGLWSPQAGLPAVAPGILGAQAGQPINTMCPVKPKQKAKASLTVTYEGQLIGFC